jgi:hypothetical protein
MTPRQEHQDHKDFLRKRQGFVRQWYGSDELLLHRMDRRFAPQRICPREEIPESRQIRVQELPQFLCVLLMMTPPPNCTQSPR